MRMFALFSVWFSATLTLSAQIVSGPMLGPVELKDAKVWLEVSPSVKTVQLVYNRKGSLQKNTLTYGGILGKPFNPIQFSISDLAINTPYEYSFVIDGKPATQRGSFTTKDLWQWRKAAPDFSFLAGSCTYFNQPEYDRPGKPYGGDSTIFETMAREKADFMLWLGDNWYTREVDFYSSRGLWYRAHVDRKQPVLQNFLKAMSHLAIWDDHDYGPDNMNLAYHLKESSREVFTNYWANTTYGTGGEGIYSMYSHSDVDFFLLDDRWWRSADRMKDSVNGQPNPEKQVYGEQQMAWLKNYLLLSTATFKIILTGNQALNTASNSDRWSRFPAEYNAFLTFVKENKIDGVLFLSGDRHLSEVIKVERPGTYPLYDVTASPLTSGSSQFSKEEQNNPARIFSLTGKQNYSRFTVMGPKGQRRLVARFLGVKGEQLGEWSVSENELKSPN